MESNKHADARPTDEVRAQIHTLMQELETLRDDARLQAHLAKMDLHDRWDTLRRRQAELQDAVRIAGADTVEALHASLTELRDNFRQLHRDAGVTRDPEC